LATASVSGIQLVQQYPDILTGPNGEPYVGQAYMDRQPDGMWEAWLVFISLETGAVIATDRETTQSTREHTLYWATGLTSTYLQGAVERAPNLRPEIPLARRVARADLGATYALAEAKVYGAAAATALRAARAARRASRARPRSPAARRPTRARRSVP
jgi:hypothetical protein